jgi:hypothetical protein
MGYRSRVILAVKNEKVAEIKAIDPVIAKLLADADKTDERDDVTFFEFDWVKWYDEYQEVKACEEWLFAMENETESEGFFEYPYQFVRIGEEMDDVEQRGNWDFGIEVSVNVSY